MDLINKLNSILNFFRKRPAITVLTVIAVIILLWFINTQRIRRYSFNGVVEDISYAEDNFPTVTIDGITYNLTYTNYDFSLKRIEKGDKLIKKRGEMDLKLIKQNTKDTTDFFINK